MKGPHARKDLAWHVSRCPKACLLLRAGAGHGSDNRFTRAKTPTVLLGVPHFNDKMEDC